MGNHEAIHIFRITHYSNLPHILENGLWTAQSDKANPNFEPIGDNSIISARKPISVPDPPGGDLSNFIPFYFGARSPMLYVIQKGFNGVTQRLPDDIVYLVVPLKCILENNLEYCFTDGNARDLSFLFRYI